MRALAGSGPVDAVLPALRRGRMVAAFDDVHEQEGDLVLAAEHATPEAIAFMAVEARGLIRVALSAARCDELELPQMTDRNELRFGTAFTVSVEARHGVSTGISAEDRARTIRVAADPSSGAADLVRPGHVFPLRAHPGGVLRRPGHTEAAVELARLAGLGPAAVICQVLDDDGAVAARPELSRFCMRHGLELVAVSEVIAHHRRAGDRARAEIAVTPGRAGLTPALPTAP
jgi:3,4-dihydroxy 2-butanone 4-phosphate synthase/GTP cyclohydrolase II